MNVGTLLTKAARTFPENLAVARGPRRCTYADFNARVNRLANAVARLGIGRGDHVALLQYNYPETLKSMFACFKAGCAVVPINFRLRPNEYAFIIDHSEARAVILSAEFNEGVLGIRDRIPEARHLITLAGGTGALHAYEALLAAESAVWSDVPVHPDDLASGGGCWRAPSGPPGRPSGTHSPRLPAVSARRSGSVRKTSQERLAA